MITPEEARQMQEMMQRGEMLTDRSVRLRWSRQRDGRWRY